jgi:hypothetical protein
VRDVDEASRALQQQEAVVSTGGSRSSWQTRRRDNESRDRPRPNNLFLVLIQAPRPAN